MGDFKSLYELQKTAKATGQTASQLESVT
jgi:hypothetical protein